MGDPEGCFRRRCRNHGQYEIRWFGKIRFGTIRRVCADHREVA